MQNTAKRLKEVEKPNNINKYKEECSGIYTCKWKCDAIYKDEATKIFTPDKVTCDDICKRSNDNYTGIEITDDISKGKENLWRRL